MFAKLKKDLLYAATPIQWKVAIQIFLLVLMLVAALAQPDAVLASPSWGDFGG